MLCAKNAGAPVENHNLGLNGGFRVLEADRKSRGECGSSTETVKSEAGRIDTKSSSIRDEVGIRSVDVLDRCEVRQTKMEKRGE